MILFQVGSLRGYYHFKHVGKGLRHKRHIHEKTKLLLSEEEVRLPRFHHVQFSYTFNNPNSLLFTVIFTLLVFLGDSVAERSWRRTCNPEVAADSSSALTSVDPSSIDSSGMFVKIFENLGGLNPCHRNFYTLFKVELLLWGPII